MDKMEQRLVSMQEQIVKVVKKIKGTVRPFVEQKNHHIIPIIHRTYSVGGTKVDIKVQFNIYES